jgi:phosphoribosyl 1,2-cyclic phosphodiesterase
VSEVAVRFWGVRGSIACPDRSVARYGGNTSCVEVRCGDHLLIFDGGTGIRLLGKALIENRAPIEADVFLSHCHIDHICGLPFFAPCYQRTSRIRLWAGNLPAPDGLAGALRQMMSDPLFPTGLENFRAQVEFRNFHAGEVLVPHPDLKVRTAPLNHPGGATGYRVEYGAHVLAYITDTEHHPGVLDPHVMALAQEADVMIYDCNYTEDEWPAHIGWGHSTWQHGVRLAEGAKAKLLVIFHHDPAHSDRVLDRIATEAKGLLPSAIVAAEGMILRL